MSDPAVVEGGRTAAAPLRRVAAVRRVVARGVTGVLVLALAGAAAWLPGALPGEGAVEDLSTVTTVDLPAAGAVVVCPGPVRLPTEPEPGADAAYDPQFDPAPEESEQTAGAVALGAADVRVGELGAEGRPASAGTAGTVAVVDDLPSALVVRASAGAASPELAAAVGAVTGEGDLQGVAAAGCGRPAAELWLVGGSTVLGSSARLVLQNPGRTPASVQVDLWGTAGPVELAGAPEFLVPPGQERAVILEGVAAEQRRVVLRLRAAGGLVSAHVQDSEVRGLVPAGVDHVVPGTGPSHRQVVTAVDVPATAADGADTAALRLLAPETATTARIRLLGPDGPEDLPGVGTVALDAGRVVDVPLGGLPAGAWTVVVDADEDVVAGALVTRGEGVGRDPEATSRAPLDRAWSPALVPGTSGVAVVPPALGGSVVLGAVPDGPSARGAGDLRVRLGLVGADGALLGEVRADVPVGTTVALPLADLLDEVDAPDDATVAGVVVAEADPRLVWALLLGEDDGVAVVAPAAPPVLRETVDVVVR